MGADWSEAAFERLREHGVGIVAHVPDAGLARLIRACEADATICTVTLTSEEEGVGLAAGAWLGGVKSAVLMQSSGVGNIVNAVASLTRACRLPLFLIVAMRGQWGETNPWQIPMGQAVPEVLAALGVVVHEVERAEDAGDAVGAGLRTAYASNAAAAVLIGQRTIGAKPFVSGGGDG